MSALSICEGNTFTPRILSISSLRPVMRAIRVSVRPQAQRSCVMLEMSCVL